MILIDDLQLAHKPPPLSEEDSPLCELPHPRVLTAGVFDGLHLAHQHLIRRVVETAHSGTSKGTAVVLTFPNHPLSLLAPPYTPKTLLAPDHKIRLIEEMNADLLVMPEFTSALASVEPEDFIRDILIGLLKVDYIIVGFDYRFGKDGRGDADLLHEHAAEFGYGLEIQPAIHYEQYTISSTYIRELIDAGRVRQAADLLGRPYELSGPVIHGYGRGAKLGFPTANLQFDPSYATPSSGVYAVRVTVGENQHMGMMNIGSSPTFAGTEYRPEVFLLDFDGDLYESNLSVHFVDRIREERKFENAHALQQRLRVDQTTARAMLEAYPKQTG